MARNRRMSGDCCDGFVGGELTDPGAEHGYNPTFGAIVNVSDRLSAGSEHEYLGHFRQPQHARRGHNDIDMTGKINDADAQNQYVGATEQGVAPGSSAGAVGQFAATSGLGNPL